MITRIPVLIALYDQDSSSVRILHSILREAKFDVRSLFFKSVNINNTMDSPSEEEIDVLVELVKELNPIFVGISVRSTLFKLACKITEKIKNKIDVPVVWGGTHVWMRPLQCLKFADAVCVGEGEGAILDLANNLSQGRQIYDIRNLCFKREGEIIRNELRPLIKNLDSLPFPDYSDENKYLVKKGEALKLSTNRSTYWIMTSRGCPFNCTYCCNTALKKIYDGNGPYLRRRSVGNVVEELKQAKDRYKNLRFVVFMDDVFTFDINWIKMFCKEYKNNINLPFFCYCHPKAITEEMIKLLKYTGVTNMTMGIQAGSENIRHDYFERYDTNEDIIRSAHILHKYKIDCAYDIIMDNPLETEKEKRQTFDLLLKLPRPFELHMSTLTNFPETKLTNILLNKKLISESDVEDEKEMSYERWSPALDLKRDKENMFWDSLYYLISKNNIWGNFIKGLSRNRFLRRYPEPMILLLRLFSTDVYTVRRDSRIDMIRLYLMKIIFRDIFVLKRDIQIFLWTKIKNRIKG